MGQTVNEDYFDWDKYLKETGSISAPSEYFRQSKIPPTNEFQVGMKLEARDPRNIASVCVASVIATTGARLRLRLDGTDNKNDFWRLVDSSDIQPVGTCEQEGDLLQPPLGYRMNVSSWPMFLLRTLTGSELAPAGFFKKEPPPPPLNNFKVGMKIEAVDRKNPFLICPATIGAVRGDQIHITFDGWSGTFDYWCKYDSRDIFPVGWCCLTGDVLQPPGNIAKKKPRGKTVTKPRKDQTELFEYEEAAPAKKKPKAKTVTKPWKDQAGHFEYEEPAAPATKKRKGKKVTKTWTDQAGLFEYEEAGPAEKKRKGKKVTKPWKDQTGLFENEEAGPAEKKRKGRPVTKPRKDEASHFENEEAARALFSALSVKSAENTPPSSYEQTKTPTSEKKKSSTSKGAQSPKMKSPQKTTLVLPVPKTSKKSGKTKPTGDTSATTKGTCKTVLPKEKGRKSWVKEKCIPVISSTSTASLSSLIRRSSSNKSPVGPSKIVMSTVCVYINKHGDCGPYLNPQKVQQLPDHFGPGPVNVILRRIVQACVDCAIDSKTVFLFIKPDNRGGEVITAFFDEKVHSVQLPPVNSASFALRFLENFCRSMQCDKFLSSQPFKPKAHIPTTTTDLDQNKPALNEELKESRRLKRCSQRPLTFAPVSSKVPRKSGRASKASSYIAVPDPSVLKQGFCKDPSTWSVDEVIQFMKHTDPHIAGPLADLFRQHVTYLLIRFSCCPYAFE
ncbi:sex comb on midleg-like protein 2 [Microtus oregoni]|uniref:sex comb on midleg-like protein 2 n=1 Tax=Microtus oregoni TaxID=111838 RepID=UPI001BB10F31|nr:sex comb on midleg-like protein 2 [Microtus oregoni]